MAELANVHPGDVLREEFIAPMGLSLRNVADASDLLRDDSTSLMEGRRPVDADIARRLSQFSGTSVQFWLGLQADYYLEEVQRAQVA
ncbi:HigA family addiction module antitoxin [Salinisphaera sp. T31B1]|uniref:HigA family addiction module antitoxin n=1 Tax=Salinisphaera sp. T31B1 TaxID=727963 RepID=UPI00333F09B4